MNGAIVKIIAGAIVGTSFMTAFSYYVSYKLERQFKEPKLLNKLLGRTNLYGRHKRVPPVTGWLIHYSVGLFFIAVYHYFWKFTLVNPSLLSGALLGFANGFIGAAGWGVLFRIHNDPPSIDFSKYYMQLIIAHIIFGLTGAAGYMLFNN